MKSPIDHLLQKICAIRAITLHAWIVALLCIPVAGTAYSVTGDKQILSVDERAWLTRNQSRLVLAVETGYAPFVFIDENGQPAGLAQDYMRLLESKLGVHFQQKRYSSLSDIFAKVKSGEVQIVNAVTSTAERAKFLTMTAPFISVPNVIIVSKDYSGQISKDKLAGLKVALVKNYAITEHITSRGGRFIPVLAANDLDALLSVSFGRADAAVIDLATASYLISDKGITNLRVAGEVEYDIRLSIGTPVSEAVLHSILNKGLAAISNDERQEIKNRWISASTEQSLFKDRLFWIVLGSVLAIASAIFFIMLFWNRTLRRQVALRKQAETRIADSEARLRTIIDNEPECIKIVDAKGILTQMNPAGLAMIEADAFEQVAGRPVLGVIAPEYRTAFIEMHQRVLAGESVQLEFEVIGLKGGRRWLETHAVPMQENGETVQLAVTRDITDRKKDARALRLERDQNQRYLDTTLALMVELDGQGKITMINRSACNLLGYAESELLGQNWFDTCLPQPYGTEVVYPFFCKMFAGDLHSAEEFENLIQCRDGRQRVIAWRNTLVAGPNGKMTGILSSGTDITERKEHQKQLEHIAHYDVLTGMPNRVLLSDRLHQGMLQAQRHQQRLAVTYLDLDGFKEINDRHGHDIGDQLLMIIATRMKQTLREGDTLARIGGDEFIAVLPDLADIESSVLMLNRLLAAAAQPVEIGERVLQVSASLGVTFYPQQQEVDADQLLRQADQAMYQAKLAGKNRYHVFDADQDSSIRGHHESLERIRRALIGREFVLHYQPKVNMRTGEVVGAEALIRWQHPEQGLLPPAVFLPLIEDHPLSVEIGEWVIDSALTQIALWHQAGLDLPVSVNVGALQLQDAGFVANLREILAAHPNVKPGCLEIEVLETSALADMKRISQVMEACRDIGVTFALDDFGTGYSSLTYLKRLPVSMLKIDQSFVRDMLDDPDDLAILEGILGLAIAFRRKVIAEGVETLESGSMLLQLGCELAQGYGIARPMPAHEMPGWAASWRPDAAWTDKAHVSRDDLPILFASVEHRAWIAAFAAFIKGEREISPPLDPNLCRFSQWLNAEGRARHEKQPAFKIVDTLHGKVHRLAAELLELHHYGKQTEALAGLAELDDLRDRLLEQLTVLVKNTNKVN